jgi:hypothetical protein
VLHSGKRIFQKKRRTAPTSSILLRVLGRHSGKASPSVRFLTLGEDLFPVRGIPGGSSPSVALGEGFPECSCPFPECIWHSEKQVSPVVCMQIVEVSPHTNFRKIYKFFGVYLVLLFCSNLDVVCCLLAHRSNPIVLFVN